MITCKEDLINTYVKNTPGLRREFLSLAVKFGLIDSKSKIGESSEEAVVAYWHDVTGDNPKVGCWFAYADQIKEECRELTLSDLKPTKQYAVLHKCGSYSFQSDKPIGDDVVACFDLVHSEKPLGEDFFDEKPRTKVEFVKVDESIWNLESDFKAGHLFAFDGQDNYVQVETEGDFTLSHSADNLYRRIETPMTEREAFIYAAVSELESGMSDKDYAEALFNSGKFKLVN